MKRTVSIIGGGWRTACWIKVLNGLSEGYIIKKVYCRNEENILVAGRTIGSDQLANSGLRVQATCMAEGQAAGAAEAIAAESGISVRHVLYGKLCEMLKKQGAIVPERS